MSYLLLSLTCLYFGLNYFIINIKSFYFHFKFNHLIYIFISKLYGYAPNLGGINRYNENNLKKSEKGIDIFLIYGIIISNK